MEGEDRQREPRKYGMFQDRFSCQRFGVRQMLRASLLNTAAVSGCVTSSSPRPTHRMKARFPLSFPSSRPAAFAACACMGGLSHVPRTRAVPDHDPRPLPAWGCADSRVEIHLCKGSRFLQLLGSAKGSDCLTLRAGTLRTWEVNRRASVCSLGPFVEKRY